MDQEIGRKWVAALRSGEYTQTTGTLRREGSGGFGGPAGFCCLGVLCDIMDPGRWGETTFTGAVCYGATNEGGAADGMPPWDILKRAALAESIPRDYGDDVRPAISADDLARRNDGGATFAEIADIIEEALR